MSTTNRPTGRSSIVSVIFDPQKLTLARQLAGLRKIELADRIGMAPASVSGWESGAQKPNEAAVAKLSLALQVEPHFFHPAGINAFVPAMPHFRSLRATSQKLQDQAYAYGRLASDVASLLEKSVEFPAPDLPSVPVDGTQTIAGLPEEAAREARRHLKLAAGPVPHLIRLVENAGVLVVFSPSQTASIDAYSFESSTRPVIVLNPEKDDYYRQRFDVAHELGHLIMHSDAEPGGRTVEDQAHRFASEFLMPAEEIAPLLPKSTTGDGWTQLRALKEHWGVSMQSLLFRARALGIMSDVSHRNAMIAISQRGWRRAEPGSVGVLEMPSLLPQAVKMLEDAGISSDQLLRGPGLPRPVFEIITSRSPIRGRSVHHATGEPSEVERRGPFAI